MNPLRPEKRPSVYLSDQLERLVADLKPVCGNKVSRVINSIAARYISVCERNVPVFTRDEWWVIIKLLKNYPTRDLNQAVNALPGAVKDYLAIHETTLSAEFVDKVTDLYFEEVLACIHISEKYWSGEIGSSTSLTDLGCRIA